MTFLAALALLAGLPLGGEGPTLRFLADADPPSVSVEGIDAANLSELATWDRSRWTDLFTVTVVGKDRTDGPPIPGRYRVAGSSVRFQPRFPIDPGLLHRARFRPDRLPRPISAKETILEFARNEAVKGASTEVVRVDPVSEVVPENLLKFYLLFSAPMSRGEVYRRVRLVGKGGKVVESPFLEIGEELWDPSGTRLTLLLDPGRIKRGLRPREEDGPILEEGKSYSLTIDREWPDADGRPLKSLFRKDFRVGAPDDVQPDPRTWTVVAPESGTSDPLTVRSPEPLDRALFDRSLTVRDGQGRQVAGKTNVDPGSTRWSFRPDGPWTAGEYQIAVNPDLEDLAGNSVSRPFEVDASARPGRSRRPRRSA